MVFAANVAPAMLTVDDPVTLIAPPPPAAAVLLATVPPVMLIADPAPAQIAPPPDDALAALFSRFTFVSVTVSPTVLNAAPLANAPFWSVRFVSDALTAAVAL